VVDIEQNSDRANSPFEIKNEILTAWQLEFDHQKKFFFKNSMR
jgi:hypothetical protein